MYNVLFSEELDKKLEKLKKREKVRFDATIKKINEIQQNPEHYKPLRHDLKDLRRVHIDKSFVLVFRIEDSTIKFLDLGHHDKIYKKKFEGA